VDFAENWCGKQQQEIQSTHFGGSHSQISLHTCMCYIGGVENPIAICTMSDNTAHGPRAIWCHLSPVLLMLRDRFPQVTQLHFMSERLADHVVLSGTDINDGYTMFKELKSRTKMILFYIPREAKIVIPVEKIPAVPALMSVHQVHSSRVGKISSRILSCYCSKDYCNCYFPRDSNVIIGCQPHIFSSENNVIKETKDMSVSGSVSASEDVSVQRVVSEAVDLFVRGDVSCTEDMSVRKGHGTTVTITKVLTIQTG